MRITFTWDDGATQDTKLFKLHEKYELPGMFFVPTKNREGRKTLSAETIKHANNELISFGAHTESHIYLTEVSMKDVEKEICSNKKYLEDILGIAIDHFCLPGGRYTKEILSLVYKHFNTIRTADTMNFHIDSKLIKPTFHMYPRGLKSMVGNAARNKSWNALIHLLPCIGKSYYETMLQLICNFAKAKNTDIIIWGHSWEIENLGIWSKLDNLMLEVSNNFKRNCVKYSSIVPNQRVE